MSSFLVLRSKSGTTKQFFCRLSTRLCGIKQIKKHNTIGNIRYLI